MRKTTPRGNLSSAKRRALILAGAVIPLCTSTAYAVQKTYSGGTSGNWTTLNWSPAGSPSNGDDVTLSPGAAVNVTYDVVGPSGTNLNNLTLDALAPGSITLVQAQGNLGIINSEFLGVSGGG